jgi:hypothetical protein
MVKKSHFKAMANRKLRTDASTSESTVRASISFPEAQYKELERIAEQHRVSLAWVVRDAIEEYLKTRWPLLISLEVEQNKQAKR